jgi:hypothetical protein
MRRFATVVLGLALAAVAACSAPPKPTAYVNSQWGFAATFPDRPKVTETAASATQAHALLVEANVGDSDFAVNVIDAAGAEGAPSEILDRTQQARAQSQDLEVGTSTPVPLGDITGREVRYDKDGTPAMLSHLFMINGRLYEVNATSAKGPTDPAVKAFLDSFHLVATADAPADIAAANAPPANAAAPTNAAHP